MTVTSIAHKSTETDTETGAAHALSDLSPSKVRENADLTQDQMARIMGMSPFGYAQWESGTRRPGGPAFRLLYLIETGGKTIVEDLLTVTD